MAATDDRRRDATRRIVEASQMLLDIERRPVPRDQHPKHHGCVRAKFVIRRDLEEAYRKGLFASGVSVYDAWIRFSNGRQRDDRKPDAHGMAIKLMGVGGPKADPDIPDDRTQDFVMVDHPVFFLRDAEEYAEFSEAVLKARGKKGSALREVLSWILPRPACEAATLSLLYFFPFRLRTLARLRAFASSVIASPLATRYYSTTPYTFGETFMKFSAVPVTVPDGQPASDRDDDVARFLEGAREMNVVSGATPRTSPNYLAHALDDALKSQGAVFQFRVQLFRNSRDTPIQDPTVEWLDQPEHAPFRPVAEIWIPPGQDIRCEAREAFCENLSFTPWHALQSHAPVGEINEVRREVYRQLSRDRHEANSVQEPQGDGPDPSGSLARWGDDPTAFPSVLKEELRHIRMRRDKLQGNGQPQAEDPADTIRRQPGDEDARTKQLRLQALREHVTGLAISGGGIRSGTFAVGFLQGLASLGLIRRLDYLSTVSGGGYAGAWLAAWLRREGGDPSNVERMMSPSRVDQSRARRLYLPDGQAGQARDGDPERAQVVDREPEALRHLRAYSSYLFPRPGILSADTWTVVLIWTRNVLINLLMLVPPAMLVVVALRAVVSIYRWFNPVTISTPLTYLLLSLLLLTLGLIAAAVAYRSNAKVLRLIRDRHATDASLRDLGTPADIRDAVLKTVINPLTVAAFLLTLTIRTLLWAGGDVLLGLQWVPQRPDQISLGSIVYDAVAAHMGLLDWPAFLVIATVLGLLLAWAASANVPTRDRAARRVFVWASFLAGATGGVLFVLLAGLVRAFARAERPDLMAALAAPLALLVVVSSLIVLVALLGRYIDENEREWWARLSALLTLRALKWIGLMATVLYVPALFLASGPWLRAAVASGWLGSAAFGVLTGRFILPKAGRVGAARLTALAAVASQIFLVGLMGLLALLAALLLNNPGLTSPSADDLGPFAYYIRGVNEAHLVPLVVVGLIAGVLYAFARGLIDVNLFSLNAMYANRLTRCYLGASRAMSNWEDRWRLPRDLRAHAGAPSLSHADDAARAVNPVTGFDTSRDDLELTRLLIGSKEEGQAYLGPHLLINTTLNLVGDHSLLHRDRKGESFLLSPLYCGSEGVGYSKLVPTAAPAQVEPNLTLGRAIAISGAAVDPNMSFYQSASLTALLTLFNARLGYWIEKPRPVGWTARSPVFGNLILTELFGRTDEHGDYVHLSDGGHFENMGVYELVRRRCRYILALDAGEDGDPSNDNLANLIRLCRIDFGVRLKLDTRPLTMEGPDRLSRTHVVVGSIHYEDVDQGEMPGVLVYIKISLTGDEPPDVQKYARKDTRFPHQPTDLRQSFDEEQFECYRCLGDHIAREVFEDPVRLVREEFASDNDGPARPAVSRPHEEYVPRLFAAVQERWTEAPEGLDELYAEANEIWSEVQRDLTTEPELRALSEDLYPELKFPGPGSAAGRPSRAELHTVARMLAIMENAWIGLSLRRTSTLPINRGWMNAFRRWVGTEAFRRSWPILRSEFSTEFVRFCEEQLQLVAASPSLLPLSAPYSELAENDPQRRGIDLLDEEFAREWPEAHRRGRGPKAVVELSRTLGADLGWLPAWLIVQAPSGPNEDAQNSPERFPCGIILAAITQLPEELQDRSDLRNLAENTKVVQLFVWVRRAYRSAGLGGRCVREVISQLPEDIALWSRYPRSNPGDDDMEYRTLLHFLSRFDFRPVGPTGPGKGGGKVLLRTPRAAADGVGEARARG